jgi:CDP-diacylglycerol--glycerol-3-phosphate 3-phosphatidyltransferase
VVAEITLIVAVYVNISFFGFFIIPLLFSREKIASFIAAINYKETNGRDGFLKAITALIAGTGVHPTAITILGFILTCSLALALFAGADYWSVFALALFAGLSDVLDGTVARFTGKITVLGGALDGLRDFCLFAVITFWFLWEGFIPYQIFLWFFIGAVFVENLKLLEVLQRRKQFSGTVESFKQRFVGVGKLSIDRAKYFTYVVASLALILETALNFKGHYVSIGLFLIAIAAAFISVLLHSAIISLESPQK